jgi:hypothetical protein
MAPVRKTEFTRVRRSGSAEYARQLSDRQIAAMTPRARILLALRLGIRGSFVKRTLASAGSLGL